MLKEGWNLRFESPNQSDTLNEDNKFIGVDELTKVDDIANFLDPADANEALSIFQAKFCLQPEEVKNIKIASSLVVLFNDTTKITRKASEFP